MPTDQEPAAQDGEGAVPAARSGRRAQASRNDTKILEAAREVFVDDPEAPISKVAERAGVGMSALYRRYSGKEELLRTLCWDGLRTFVAIAEEALARTEGATGADLADGFRWFMQATVESDTSSLVQKLAGTFPPVEGMWADAARADQLGSDLFERVKAGGLLRDGVEHHDLTVIVEMLAQVRVGDRARMQGFRRRYLALLLEALMSTENSDPLPGSPPTWEEISQRWSTD